MVRDYGVRGEPHHAWLWPAFGYVCAAAAALAALFVGVSAVQALDAQAAYWKVTGPPCPSLTRRAFLARGVKTDQSFHFQALVLARAYGWADCAEQVVMGRTVDICQFTNPGVLAITTSSGAAYFAPGVGRPATVIASKGLVRCVLASNYRSNP